MNEKLSAFHIATLIYMIENNITLFALPRLVAENMGTNGWVGYIFLALVSTGNILLYLVVYRMGKGRSMFDILEKSLSKWILYPVYAGLAVFYIMIASFVGKNFFLIFQMISFQTSNVTFIFLLFCMMVYFLLIKPVYSIGKAATVFAFMTWWTLLLTSYQAREWKLIRLTSYFFEDPAGGQVLHNWAEVYTSFIGYELCIFLFPYVNKKSKLFKGVLYGHLLTALAQVIVLLTAFGFFSFQQLQSLLYPIIDMLDFIEMPFINRVENLVFVIFVFGNLISTTMFSFASLSMVKRIFPKTRPKRLEFLIVLGVFIVGFYSKYLSQSEYQLRRVLFTEIGIAFILPMLLILVLLFQKLRERMNSHEH
ncbi:MULTISPECIES: GerAB/ArcD/ProY family transporter [Paenibacillus]|uniref:GerAB/ArcD/ProY family transporter n=1 Tax=Paenibacillus TaxID=44249 RepID=UPI000E247FD2|nr:GerAB/ArcD/ProY family transporter [Paenibacillus sp. VMFN-D1]MCM3000925.1 spore germination protein [Paenibacillus cellulositrophicus]RED33569.1 spore germination protein (amino acid permease) [Paenibacillus sp. VMFN-D1]